MSNIPADVCPLEPSGPDSTSTPITFTIDDDGAHATGAAHAASATGEEHSLNAECAATIEALCTEAEHSHSDEACMAIEQHPLYANFCPRFHRGIELIGRRWTGAMVRAMLGGATRFSDIASAVPGLSDRLLSERLRELEAAGVITRTVIPAIPVRVEYALTESGRALDPVISAVANWAETWVS